VIRRAARLLPRWIAGGIQAGPPVSMIVPDRPDVDYPTVWFERWKMWLPDYDATYMALAFPPRRRRISVLFDADPVPDKVYTVAGGHFSPPQAEDPEFVRDCAELAEGSCPECRQPLSPGGYCCPRAECSQRRLEIIDRDIWARCPCCGLGWALGTDDVGVWISREVNGHGDWDVFTSHERKHSHPLGMPVDWTNTSWCPLPEDDVFKRYQTPGTEEKLAQSIKRNLAGWRSVGLWPLDQS